MMNAGQAERWMSRRRYSGGQGPSGPQFRYSAFQGPRGNAYADAEASVYRRQQALRRMADDNALEGLYSRKMPPFWYQPAQGSPDPRDPFQSLGPGAAFRNPKFPQLYAQYLAMRAQGR